MLGDCSYLIMKPFSAFLFCLSIDTGIGEEGSLRFKEVEFHGALFSSDKRNTENSIFATFYRPEFLFIMDLQIPQFT